MLIHDLLKRLIVSPGALIGMSLLLAGCSALGGSISTPATVAITTPAATPTSTSTPTPAPTKTPAPTATPIIVSTPVRPKVDIGVDQVWISPNKLWIAVLSGLTVKIAPNDKLQTSGELELRTILEVINSTNTQKWLVEDMPADSFMSYEEPWPLAWSHDGQYLYVTHRLGGGDGCFTAAEFYGTDLLKIDLTNGHVSEIVPRVGDWVALSPDEAQFAYLSRDQSLGKQWLVIRDLATGDERRRPVDELNEYDISWATDLIWSPDGTTLVYTLKINVCGSPEDESTSIVAVNANSLEQKTLIREDKRWLQFIQWLANGKVLLKDHSGAFWWMNPNTGDLMIAK